MDQPFMADMYKVENTQGTIHYDYSGVDYTNAYSSQPKFGWKVTAVCEDIKIDAHLNDCRRTRHPTCYLCINVFSLQSPMALRRTSGQVLKV